MEKWEIGYWEDSSGKKVVERWLDSLTKEQLKSITKKIRFLEKVGNTLKLPHSRPLGKGLFELRELQFGLRIYYCFCGNKIIILLEAGDKKSQKNDMKIARGRLASLVEPIKIEKN